MMSPRPMTRHWPIRFVTVLTLFVAAAGPGMRAVPGPRRGPARDNWTETSPGVLRSRGIPGAFALTAGGHALVIDLPRSELLDELSERGLAVERVLLTHHHRHTADGAAAARRQGVPVFGPKAEMDWLTPEGVARFWKESVPLRNSRTAYFVVSAGVSGIEPTLEDGQVIDWRGWRIQVLATPGHSPGHVSFVTSRGSNGPKIVLCGDAMAAPGTIASPFTLEWDHWTDSGAKSAAASLARLAALEADIVCPAHGAPITHDVGTAIRRTQAAVEEVAFLKSFERFSTMRLGDPPSYRFLAPDQVASSGEKPWSQVSEHLFVTGNTYVLSSARGSAMAIDLWGKRSVEQVQKLVADRGLAPPEIVWVSHAHYDHFDGIYDMPDRNKFEVWTLRGTADVLEAPGRFRAPFLDPRPISIARKLEPGDEVEWHEYRFRIHHLPGQTVFTMGIETTIDGHRSLFTADNFFHMSQFSGSGGWTGLNRALPAGYATSARKVLELAPEWVLAEHGGPFQFQADDFRRRVAWAEAAAGAADRLAPSGDHRRDWDPHRVCFEPVWVAAKPGDMIRVQLRVDDAALLRDDMRIEIEGRGLLRNELLRLADFHNGGTPCVKDLRWHLPDSFPSGRHVFAARVFVADVMQTVDATMTVDVE